jgi:hypothetical protein
MIELTGGGFAAIAAVLSFIAGGGAQRSIRRRPTRGRRQFRPRNCAGTDQVSDL